MTFLVSHDLSPAGFGVGTEGTSFGDPVAVEGEGTGWVEEDVQKWIWKTHVNPQVYVLLYCIQYNIIYIYIYIYYIRIYIYYIYVYIYIYIVYYPFPK